MVHFYLLDGTVFSLVSFKDESSSGWAREALVDKGIQLKQQNDGK